MRIHQESWVSKQLGSSAESPRCALISSCSSMGSVATREGMRILMDLYVKAKLGMKHFARHIDPCPSRPSFILAEFLNRCSSQDHRVQQRLKDLLNNPISTYQQHCPFPLQTELTCVHFASLDSSSAGTPSSSSRVFTRYCFVLNSERKA